MNRRRVLGFTAALFASGSALVSSEALAVKLPISKITVDVLSVAQEAYKSSRTPDGTVWENVTYVAQARIQQVLETDHNLQPGLVIQIHYEVRLRTPPAPGMRPSPMLRQGETKTVEVSGHDREFFLRG